MTAWLPRFRLFGWHGTDIGDDNAEAHGALLRIEWRSWLAEISVGRVYQ